MPITLHLEGRLDLISVPPVLPSQRKVASFELFRFCYSVLVHGFSPHGKSSVKFHTHRKVVIAQTPCTTLNSLVGYSRVTSLLRDLTSPKETGEVFRLLKKGNIYFYTPVPFVHLKGSNRHSTHFVPSTSTRSPVSEWSSTGLS